MKPTKILMCALATGLMAFASDKAQATVINTNLYTPLTIKATVSYIASANTNKIKKATITSKQILAYMVANDGFPTGTQLAIGPGTNGNNADVYLISKTNVIADLTTKGYFNFNPTNLIETATGTKGTTAYKRSEAGVITIDFYSGKFTGANFQENTYAYELTGTYTYNESDSAAVNGLVKKSSNFSSSNLGGFGYAKLLDDVDNYLPLSGSASGSASGKVAE
jgi:hypothetical protein